MTVDCPICIARGFGVRQYAGSPNPLTAFSYKGRVHACPDMCIESRGQRIEAGQVELTDGLRAEFEAGQLPCIIALCQYGDMCDQLIAQKWSAA